MVESDNTAATEVDLTEREPLQSLRRVAAKFFLLASLGAVALIHMPFLPLQVQAIGHWWGNLAGQDQRWTMFSAEPRATSIDLWAELDYVDGTSERWLVNHGGFGGDLSDYHWVQWAEAAVLEGSPKQVASLASWLVRTAPRPVVSVRIVAWSRAGAPPGTNRPRGHSELIYELHVDQPTELASSSP